MVESSHPQTMQRMQSVPADNMVDQPMIQTVSTEFRRINSENPELVQETQQNINTVPVKDDFDHCLIMDSENFSQFTSEEEENKNELMQQLQSQFKNKEDQKLEAELFLDIFTDISIFQVGLVKPGNQKGSIESKDFFVPIFPFMYESIEHGEQIVDYRNAISLHLQPESSQRVR